MPTIAIPLQDLILDPETDPDAGAEAGTQISDAYAFLGSVTVSVEGDLVHITLPDPPAQQRDEALRTYARAVRLAEQGKQRQTVQLFEKVLEVLPAHTDARRNLAMAHLESGEPEKAKELLVQTLRLDPRDAWACLLLGNIHTQAGNVDLAMQLFDKAAALSPRDPLIAANYGAGLAMQKRTEEAREQFLRAIEMGPDHPNSYYGLAQIAYNDGDYRLAVTSLDNMFSIAKGASARSQGFFDKARQLYLDASIAAADEAHAELMALVDERIREVESISGLPVRMVEDRSLQIPASIQSGWQHGRNHHLLRYRDRDSVAMPHLLLHELEHIVMEAEAREAGLARTFTSTAETQRTAMSAVDGHARALTRSGVAGEFVDEWIPQAVEIIRSQLYNIPIDMIIEERLADRYETLRSCQFVSLYQMHQQAVPTLTDQHLRQITPPVIYRATLSLNHAFALTIDHLYGARLDCAVPYRREAAAVNGPRIFALWQRTMRRFKPGDEYRFVDDVAKLLDLAGWYQWRIEEEGVSPTLGEPDQPEGATNPELLEEREPAVVMYCLDALERFAGMSDLEVKQIGFEIGLLGQGGLDYASSDVKYTLKALPGEEFSGLALMAMMYVAFQRIDPSLDLQLPFRDAYRRALGLFRGRT